MAVACVLLLLNIHFMTIDIVDATQCPQLSCNKNDTRLLDKQLCFQHSADDPVSRLQIERCRDDKEGNKYRCIMEKGDYAWVNSDLQFDETRNFKDKE